LVKETKEIRLYTSNVVREGFKVGKTWKPEKEQQLELYKRGMRDHVNESPPFSYFGHQQGRDNIRKDR